MLHYPDCMLHYPDCTDLLLVPTPEPHCTRRAAPRAPGAPCDPVAPCAPEIAAFGARQVHTPLRQPLSPTADAPLAAAAANGASGAPPAAAAADAMADGAVDARECFGGVDHTRIGRMAAGYLRRVHEPEVPIAAPIAAPITLIHLIAC